MEKNTPVKEEKTIWCHQCASEQVIIYTYPDRCVMLKCNHEVKM